MAEKISTEGKRIHDEAPSDKFAEFMRGGWAPSPLTGIEPSPAVDYCVKRRAKLSEAFAGLRIVLPSGNDKLRSNDTYYRYRPHSAFAYYTGVQGVDANPDAVLVLEPTANGHEPILFIMPRSTRESDAFYRDAKYGELWVGRRFTTDEAAKKYLIETRSVADLEKFLAEKKPSVALHGLDRTVDEKVSAHDRDNELSVFVSEQRLIKDEYEISEMRRAVDATALGFADMMKVLQEATKHNRGERVVESAFFGRARTDGHDLGYETIAAAGSHACVLHWIRNDGKVKNGELMLIDAGIEMESYYTADVTRTVPVNGKYSPAQKSLYNLVYESQNAGLAAIKPGVPFTEINKACQKVLAHGLADMGVLTVSAEEALKPENGFHRRWTLHNVSHMLGIDVHDCAQARKEEYMKPLEVGMVLTVEPGLYIQPDDELFAPEYRGIGIRIEDDVLVTKDGVENLSGNLPRHPDEIEKWMAGLTS